MNDRQFNGSLEQLQSLDLDTKIQMTINRINAFKSWAISNPPPTESSFLSVVAKIVLY